MKTTKQIGIWMDHSNAFFIEVSGDTAKNSSITSEFSHEDKESSLRKSESLVHNKEQQKQSAYFSKIAAVIKNYNEVVFFGPTDAKSELINLLKTDHLFENIKMEAKQTDKMTGYQMHSFVKNYFK